MRDGLVHTAGDWYVFRTVSTSSRQEMVTTPSLLFMNARSGECWSLVVSRVVDYEACPLGETMIYRYSLAWLRAGESDYEPEPWRVAPLFAELITQFRVELALKGIIDE